MSRLYATFRERFKAAVVEDGRSCSKLAVRSGYNADYLRSILRGKKHNCTLLFVEVMADTLNVDPVWLLGLDGVEADGRT